MLNFRRWFAIAGALVVMTGCGSDSPPRPDAQGKPSTTTTSSTSTTTISTTTTTTTTLPPVLVPGPVKLGAVCTVPGGVSSVAEGSPVRCVDRKSVTAKPYSNGKLRWTP